MDLKGKPVEPNREGFLIIRRPWPSMLRTLWRDPQRYEEQYWKRIPGIYLTGDAARRDDDGYFWVLGRVDDVMNVSGHRLSTMEMESALVRHPAVAEAAVVGKPHEITGQAVACFVTLKKGNWNHERAGAGAAQVGSARDRQLRQTGADPLHRRAAQNAQRQDHAPTAARDRDVEHGSRRRDHARGSVGGDAAGGTARGGVGEAEMFHIARRGDGATRGHGETPGFAPIASPKLGRAPSPACRPSRPRCVASGRCVRAWGRRGKS